MRLNPGSKDVLIGANDPAGSIFEIPQDGGPPLKMTGFSRFITTKAVGLLLPAEHDGPEVDRGSLPRRQFCRGRRGRRRARPRVRRSSTTRRGHE